MEGDGTGGREGEGEGVGEERAGVSGFFHEPTCQPYAQPMHLSDDADMLSCNG